MNDKLLNQFSRIALPVALLLTSCAFWLIGDSRAEAVSADPASSVAHDSVQDNVDRDPLDLKIFVHRHGLLVHSLDGAPQGRANADVQRIGT